MGMGISVVSSASSTTADVVSSGASRDGTSELPTFARERIWGFWSFTSVNIGLAIATWAFLTGGTIAVFVGVKEAIAASIIGNLLGVALVSAGTCLPAQKYGVEQFTMLRTVFGATGCRILAIVLFVPAAAGWNAILAIMCGRALANVLNATAGTNLKPDGLPVIGISLLIIATAWVLLVKGPVSIEWVNKFVAPLLALITVVMLTIIFIDHPWSQLTAIKPLEPFGDPDLDWMIAVELSLGTGFSWWTIMGNLTRLTTTPRAALWPNMIGIFGASVLASTVGTAAALALGDSDPTVWMIPLGGVLLGVMALLFIAAANITSMVSQSYAGALAIRRAGGSKLGAIPWWLFTLILFIPSMILSFWPSAIYDNFFKFLAWVSLVLAPLAAVYFTDYFLLRHQRLNVRDIYLPEGQSLYSFWAGINPVAFLAVISGAVTYFFILNPLTFKAAGIFQHTTASIPAFVVTAVIYYVLTSLIVIPLGKGGYRTRTGAQNQ